jgi:hypothetical protein
MKKRKKWWKILEMNAHSHEKYRASVDVMTIA